MPAVGEDGGVLPAARRIITPARSPSPGLVHDNVIDVVVVLVTDRPVTAPGGVVSGLGVGGGTTVPVIVIDRVDEVVAGAPSAAVVTTR